ncbi:hypothetical protein ACI2KS_23950 [Pseudomonas sp. NPDC087358]|uniref:hypothetical protein n=1 Tax=Pseudomonas sp. NPDC087358 TaxID=3364439 RepID=UPI00384CBFE6
MNTIDVKTVKAFDNAGEFVNPGRTIPVDEIRAGELLRNGLIEDYTVKASSTPANKQAPRPENKAGKPKPPPEKKAD